MRECLKREARYRTSKSSGPGGQHVNKTESRVELLWNPMESLCLDDQARILVMRRWKSRITNEGIFMLACEKHRSQHRNKEEVTERFLHLVLSALVRVKKRKPTRPSRSSVEKRIKEKKIRGEIKRSRKDRSEE